MKDIEATDSGSLYGPVPPENGEIAFSMRVRPVSLQASRSRRDVISRELASVVVPIPYLLSGDLSVQLTWHINEDERYESDEPADVDNIIKPILDALSGPSGVMINDCQVQHISCHWISRYAEEEHVDILIKYLNNEFYPKSQLLFVQLRGPFCMPMREDLSEEAKRCLLTAYCAQLDSRDQLTALGVPAFAARGGMSIQRPFHKSRLGAFRVVSPSDLGV